MQPADPLNISALNQYSYCARRCALIYVEGQFSDNLHTQRGKAEHERVDRSAHITRRDGARVEYALPIWSDRLGLIGKCDVVEFWPDGLIYPVEYKHGPRRAWLNDDLQVAAQAICLEEMFDCAITEGAIFHAASKRRREVKFTPSLRQQLEDCIAELRAMLERGKLPPPTDDVRRCAGCSMNDICQPEAVRAIAARAPAPAWLFDPDG